MSEPYIGQIQIFGFNFPPRGWAHCDGQLLPISQNTALFSLLGTIYGGDGQTTFGLPDLRGRAAMHFGNGPGLPDYQLGQKPGVLDHQLNVANLPAHSHDVRAVDGNADSVFPNNGMLSITREDTYRSSGGDLVNLNSSSVGDTGIGEPFSSLQPSLVLNWCIALVGIFPPRN